MAITKIIAIRDRLDKRVAYVASAEKTTLNCGVRYIVNPEKTEKSFFAAVLNCSSPESAHREMMETKGKKQTGCRVTISSSLLHREK